MRISRSALDSLGILAAVAMLAGCNDSGGPQSTAVAPASGMNNTARSSPLGHRVADTFIGIKRVERAHPDHHKSWISPDARRAPRLFFASDSANNDVYIFALPSMTLKGTLTGFDEPQGECADTHGNIWITNTNGLEILEYSRTGKLLNTVTDSYGYPVGCAVDPANGDLAVADISGLSGAGQVLVFTSPSATPTVLTNPSQYEYYFLGYGPGSSLWVDGKDSSGVFILSGCGPSSCSTIPLSGGTIYFPGAVQWVGAAGTWVVFDQICGGRTGACSYPVSGSGVLGTATTYLDHSGGAVCDLIQGVIGANGAKYTVGGDYHGYCGKRRDSSFNRWAYSAGGTPTNYSTRSTSLAVGAAISTK